MNVCVSVYVCALNYCHVSVCLSCFVILFPPCLCDFGLVLLVFVDRGQCMVVFFLNSCISLYPEYGNKPGALKLCFHVFSLQHNRDNYNC